MRVTRVRLSNFKCYTDADVSLPAGVTVIHGPNGAGKSSLLEAVFFALYGATALDATLDDLVTRGAEAAEVEVWFSHAGGDYHVERRVRATGERAQTATCVLETPDDTVEGATDVREAVVDLLRMDADAFVNCAYVRQGEVNKLINATPTERQAMLDDLLQLGTLERYRERAASARLGVEDVLTGVEANVDQLDDQVEAKASKDLPQALNALETELASVTSDIERFEANREEARETLEAAAAVLEEHAERAETIAALDEEVDTLSARIAETEREREEIADRIGDRRERAEELATERDDLAAATDLETVTAESVEDRLAALEAEVDDLDDRRRTLEIERTETASEASTARERAAELDDEAAAAHEAAAELEAAVEEASAAVAERRDALDALDAEREAVEARFEDAPVEPGEAEAHRDVLVEDRDDLRAERSELQADLEAARHRVAHAESLLEEGKCPECGQSVEGSPHVDAVEDDRERVADLEAELDGLDDRLGAADGAIEDAEALLEAERELARLETERSNLEQLVAEREATVDEQRERLADRRERADSLETEADARREAATAAVETLEALDAALEAVDEKRGALVQRVDRLDAVAERLEQLAAVDRAIERLGERRDLLGERNDERRETLADKRDRRDELEAAVDEARVETAREDRSRAEDYLAEVDPKLERLRERRDELQGQVGAVENELTELESLRERRAGLAERVDRLASLREEADALEALYGDLRAELRQQNIASLERLLNETFELVYRNDAYARIELDQDYALTVYQKDGESLEPEQLSGGERALFNLSLRTAIYRLLAEGIDGAAPMPPLILDEPTVFLDAGHVSRLVELVETMRELGVEQIVVVSHDEELIGAADELLTVQKDATTNRSTVERGPQPEVLAD